MVRGFLFHGPFLALGNSSDNKWVTLFGKKQPNDR